MYVSDGFLLLLIDFMYPNFHQFFEITLFELNGELGNELLLIHKMLKGNWKNSLSTSLRNKQELY